MEIPDEVLAKIKLALYEGKKIEAIKLYREQTALGLKESKDFIDKMEAEMREKDPQRFNHAASKSGCSAILAFVVMVGIGAAMLVF